MVGRVVMNSLCRSLPPLRNCLLRPSTSLSAVSKRSFSTEPVNLTFIDIDDTEIKVKAESGKSVLDIAHDNDIEIEGACGSELACSTCHVILDDEFYDKLPRPTEEEDDMLDLAWGLTEQSRLGCQVMVDKSCEGMRIRLPKETHNMCD